MLVAGEAGIGKTRVAEELAADARAREVRVVWGRCHEGEGAPAYWPWRLALRASAELGQLMPELAEAATGPLPAAGLDPVMARFRLFDAMTAALRSAAADTGLVVVLDDLHWADRASLLLLEFVARELADSRLLLVGTYRDVEVDRRHRLSSTLAELFRQPVTSRLALGGLDEGQVSRFIANVAGIDPAADLVAALHGQTEGNPYFVSELVRLLAAEHRLEASGLLAGGIPEGIRHVIGRRLNRLPEAVNASLAVASVQGREFDLDVVARAAGLPSDEVLDALEEAMDARLVTEAGTKPGRFRFAHALVRETLYDELPVRQRRRLHDQVGAALAELRADDLEAQLAELAHHFSQAARPGRARQAVVYARQAGDRAMEVLAYEEAAGHYERALRALDLQEPTDQAERCELLLALAAARMAAGEVADARAQYERAATLAKRTGDGEQLARAAFGLGVEFTAGTVDELEVRLLEEALAVLGETDSILRARVLGRLAKALQSSPDPDRRAALSDTAVAMARRIGDPVALAAVLYDRHMATWAPGNLLERRAISGEVVQLAESSGDSLMALRGRGFLMANLLELGDMAALRRELDTYRHTAQELRQPHFLWHVPLFEAGQELLAGRFDDAERLVQEALALGRRARDPVVAIYHPIVLTGLRWGQGRLPELEETLAHALDDPDRASTLYELLAPYADHNVLVARLPLGTLGSSRQFLGLLAAAMGRWDDALAQLDAAVQAHERIGAPPLQARSRHRYAKVLLARGRPDDRARAQQHLEWAGAAARRLGMRRLAIG